MKYFNQLFSFTICMSLALGPVQYVHAEDSEIQAGKSQSTQQKYSAHAYNRKDFCSGEEGAEKLMTDLQKANAEKFDQIAIYKAEIADLVESDKLINATRDIKDRYLNSLQKIAKEDATIGESLGYAQAVKFDGAVLESVTDTDTKPKQPSFLSSLKTKYSNMKNSFSSDLAKDTQNKVDQVVAEVPAEISPEQVKKMMESGSPTVNRLIEKKLNKDEVTSCLNNESETACSKIGISEDDKTALKKEMKTLSQKLNLTGSFTKLDKIQGSAALTPIEATKRAKIDKELLKLVTETETAMVENSKKLDQLNVNESTKKSLEKTSQQMQLQTQRSDYEKAKEQIAREEKSLVGMEIFFHSTPSNMEEYLNAMGIDVKTNEGAKQAVQLRKDSIENAKADAAIFKRDCSFSNKDTSDVSTEQLELCQGLVSKVLPKIQNLKNSHIDKIAELNTKIQKLASNDNFADVENLKKYIAEKYMCSCNKKTKKTLSINKEQESLVLRGESCSTEFLTLSKIEGLSSDSNAIADALYAHEIKIPMDAESCVMTPEKLKPFSETCSSSNQYINNNFPDICKQITNEYVVKVQNQELVAKQNAKWEKYNEENYVEYNSKSPTGYSAVKKKSTWRVVGEGVLPVLPNALPIWLGNYQMKNNINTLTDQALLQKQYLHNIDIYNQSPWMYNFNYFGYGNPFMSGSTTLGGSTGLGGSSGFNFGL